MRQPLLILLAALVCSAQSSSPSAPAKAAVPALPPGVQAETNIAYDRYPQTVLDVFTPPSNGKGTKRCGVLMIHGGGWVNGTKESMVERWVLPWVDKGCVVANVEYRLAAVATAPAAV